MPDVIIVHDPRATVAFAAQADVVADMVARGVMAVTGQDSVSAAWRALVQPEDVVGVKVHSPPGPLSGTRPAVAAAVVRGPLDAPAPRADRHLGSAHERSARRGLRRAGSFPRRARRRRGRVGFRPGRPLPESAPGPARLWRPRVPPWSGFHQRGRRPEVAPEQVADT